MVKNKSSRILPIISSVLGIICLVGIADIFLWAQYDYISILSGISILGTIPNFILSRYIKRRVEGYDIFTKRLIATNAIISILSLIFWIGFIAFLFFAFGSSI